MSTSARPLGDRFAVGLTGGIGSGKTTVADLFAAQGAAVIDTDLIAHQLTAPGGHAIDAIAAQFGAQFLTPSGAMDRAKMRTRVFSDPAARQRLEAILHPLIRQQTAMAAVQAPGDYLMFVVPLLVESGSWRQQVSRVLVIDCPEDLQLTRVMQRSALTEDQVRSIMASQATRAQRLAAADDVLLNDGSAADLIPQIARLHAVYKRLAGATPTKQP